MTKRPRRISRFFSLPFVAGASALIIGGATAVAGANQFAQRYLSSAAKDSMFSEPVAATLPESMSTPARSQIVVRLNEPPVALSDLTTADAIEAINAEQQGFLDRCLKLGDIKVLSQTRVALNAVFLDLDTALVDPVSGDPAVQRIAPVSHYTLDLSETVPLIGADVAQSRGIDGEGISVAVLDSGVDYTHADLGGSGDPADYINNDGAIIEPGTFPTERVVGGFDFLGNVWPTGPGGFGDAPIPDPDPIDDLALVPGAFAGHGTHVADIIGGNLGVAPGVDLYALKVCASLTPNCNGIALINGVEFVVDPNGDGDPEDHLDIMNLSLGADYGRPFDDDLSAAIDNATAIGVLTVAAAGNCGDNPYCTGTPAAAPTALSVAQTEVPSALLNFMNVVEPAELAGLYSAVQYSWSAELTSIEGPVQYGDLDGTNLLGCDPFTGDLTGLIVAVDRGECAFAQKIRNIQNAGGTAGIVMLVDVGPPFDGLFDGGEPITIPGFNIGQADGNILRAGGAVVGFGPEFTESLSGVTRPSTARGPDLSFNALKPEIGAPGASIS
ncbi:MAG: S8 family serine peptidase, partial [Myxococcota bacterium]